MPAGHPLNSDALKPLGFTTNPFQDSADPAFLYLTKQHQFVVQRTRDLVYWKQGLGMIEGAVGVGKSSVARHLYAVYDTTAQTGEEHQVIYLPTADYSTVSIAARGLAAALNLATHRKVIYQMGVLYEYLIQMRQQQKDVIVLWDDCQLMKPAALELFQLLWNFDVSGKLIQMILFATPAIHLSVSGYPDLVNRFAQWDRLSPLDPTEAYNLIVHRCHVAGRDDPLLNESAFAALYDFSKGLPRQMVLICYEVLRLLHHHDRKLATGDDVIQAINIYRQREPTQP